MVTDTDTVELTLGDVKIEDAGPAAKKITIEIPAEVVDQRLEGSFGLLQTNAAVPGFRRGKAPKRLLERRFGEDIKNETKNELVRDSFQKVIKDNELHVIGDPVFDEPEAIELTSGQSMVYSFELEVVPDFDLPDLDGIEISKPVVELEEEMVDAEIEDQKRRLGQVQIVEDEAQPGDYFLGSAKLLDESGEELGHLDETITQYPMPDAEGPGAVAGIKVDNLDKLLPGQSVGDTLNIKATGPEQHEIEAVRGKDITIEFAIQGVRRLIPATTEELSQRFGMSDEAMLREMVEGAMQSKIDSEQRDVMRRQVVRYLLDHVEVDLPERASENQAARNLERARLQLMQEGATAYQIEERLAEIRSASKEAAQRDLKIMFLLERLANEYDITTEEQEVNMRLVQIARQQGIPLDDLRKRMDETGQWSLLNMQVKHEKVSDFVINEKAKLVEKSVEEWNKEQQEEDTAEE